jgi:hypothetical protein
MEHPHVGLDQKNSGNATATFRLDVSGKMDVPGQKKGSFS